MTNKIIKRITQRRITFLDSYDYEHILGNIILEETYETDGKWYSLDKLIGIKIKEIKLTNKNGDVIEEQENDNFMKLMENGIVLIN